MAKKHNNARRSPFAAVVVILAGLLVTGGGYSVANAVVSHQGETTAVDAGSVTEGKNLFQANCASCHGKNAEGTSFAPSLIGVGAASVDFQVGTGRMPAQASGPQMTDKTPQFTDAQIKALAAYVASLAPGPAVPSGKYVNPVTDPEALSKGGELFRINCAMCHNAVGAGGALTEGKWALNLKDTSNVEMYEAMITGPQNMPVFSDANLSPEKKQQIISYLTYLQNNPSPGGEELANLGPVAEGLFAWIFMLGGIVLITIWLGAKSN